MDIHQFYSARISELDTHLKKLGVQTQYLSFARLLSFIAIIIVFYLLFAISPVLAIIFLVFGIVGFGLVLNYHLKIEHKRKFTQCLQTINIQELECLDGNTSAFFNGNCYVERDHPYTADLDIFGPSSLYQFINRTNTKPGADLLASWLKSPAPSEKILLRQDAAKELSEKFEWRQNFQAMGMMNAKTGNDIPGIFEWIEQPKLLKGKKGFLIGLYLLSIILFGSLVFWFFGLQGAWLSIPFSISLAINYKYLKKVSVVQQNLSKAYDTLSSYASIIRLIENENFSSTKLKKLKEKINGSGKASAAIKDLAGILKRLDYRLNIIVGIPLNLFLFWDIHQVIQLDNWKEKHKDKLHNWFDTMAEFETLASIANLSFNNKKWIYPKVTDDYFRLKGEEVGHPLISAVKRVSNNFEIDSAGKIALITGSNMSGKSTFLRTCGVNIVLSLTGAAVCAKSFEISNVLLYTSMRITDSLEENISSFYAELRRLAAIIKIVEKKEKVFLLLDEILRGTNSNDRHTGSVALIKQLVKNNAPGLIATHDLALSTLQDEMKDKLNIYNFDVKIHNDELYFDYKINPGVCKSLNASILMKKMGIEL